MKLLILGDVCATAATAPYFEKEDLSTLFTDTLDLFKKADYTFVNLECAITDSEHKIEKFGPNLKAPKATAKVLKTVGVDLVGLCNNHIFDFGIEGYEDTVKALSEQGLAYTGFGKNYQDSRKNHIFEKDGKKVCIITVCEHEYSYALPDRMGARPYDCYDTVADVRKAKAECDRVVVIYHGGKEHCHYPSPRMVKLCRALVDNGADVVVAQHTHCICCYENYEGGHILYGQGNFHFVMDYPNEPGWAYELALIYDADANTVEFIPTNQTETGIELTKGETYAKITQQFKELCDAMQDGTWYNGWKAYCDGRKEVYNNMLASAFGPDATEIRYKRLAHLLDCEAHHDVLVEIHKTANHTNER